MNKVLTNLFASDLQKSQLRKKLTRTTFLTAADSFPFWTPSSARTNKLVRAGLSAANRNLSTSQLLVAPRTALTTVSEVGGMEVTKGARRDGMGGCGAMAIIFFFIVPVFLLYSMAPHHVT